MKWKGRKAMTRKERGLRASAHHEAGHAVAALSQGLKFKYTTIRPKDDSLGQVKYSRIPRWFDPESGNSDRTRFLAERYIVRCFAGQFAEGKFRGKRPTFGSMSDDKAAAEMAFHLFGSSETTSAFLRFCFLSSRDLVNAHWREIRAVAKA